MTSMAYGKNPELPKVRRDAVRLVKYRGWSVRKAARHLGYTHSAIVKWCAKDPTGGWHEIPTRSSRPKTSPTALTREVISAIIAKRQGRRRCGQIIHQELLRDGISVSLPSVQRTLSRLGLLKKRSPWKRPHDGTERPEATHPGALLEADTVHIMLPKGDRLYIYTLIDLYSRWAYAEIVTRISGAASFSFIARAQTMAPFKFSMVQTDNGPEFQKLFRFRLAKHGMSHRHSRVRRSNDQAHIERFNRTIQEECFDRTAPTLRHFRHALKSWLPYYNTERMHMGINFQTPAQMLKAVPRS
ncbi:MAG: DDE-type integrase/transposase/recombinase [Patescibacteria group bacterium]